jgi:hypothetical protein
VVSRRAHQLERSFKVRDAHGGALAAHGEHGFVFVPADAAEDDALVNAALDERGVDGGREHDDVIVTRAWAGA